MRPNKNISLEEFLILTVKITAVACSLILLYSNITLFSNFLDIKLQDGTLADTILGVSAKVKFFLLIGLSY